MEWSRKRRSPETFFVMALFCVFALSAVVLALLGAGVYRNTADQMDTTFDRGAAMAYLRTKIRQGDQAGAITVGDLGGTTAIIIESQQDDRSYYTYLYYHDGALKELYAMPGSGAGPEMGEQIVELTDFQIQQQTDRMLLLTAVDRQGDTSQVSVYLRSGGS